MTSLVSLKSGIETLDANIGTATSNGKATLDSPMSTTTSNTPQFSFDFDKLRRNMEAFQARFDAYIANDRKRILEERNAFEKDMAEAREHEQHMGNQIEHYKEKEAELVQESAREQQEVQETESSIAEFTRKKQDLTILRDAVVAQIRETQSLLDKKRAERSVDRAKFLAQSSLNAPELAFWEQNLGMRIEGFKDDQLKIVYSLVSESSWNREYYVLVDLSDHEYEVLRCEPQLENSVLEGIVARLNESRDFGRFLTDIRKAFKESGL
ncbi:chromosome segregation protein Spc25-domain-containing protein [Lipomyces tetrasporus]|uniref:Kinetochore protein SPC25 n=1 Tax=Lipomyces tetrasporus TaxID=54092 RepID=A0AAD7QPW5_9ASCO|nr:chromosome segregation protein Spc25-domain-containing protein [Lipomyces tetrasporus]KAJ8099045.1 chromosome segregation protein Spc25-domain-containing protein [Lipomyces tetrasporus]